MRAHRWSLFLIFLCSCSRPEFGPEFPEHLLQLENTGPVIDQSACWFNGTWMNEEGLNQQRLIVEVVGQSFRAVDQADQFYWCVVGCRVTFFIEGTIHRAARTATGAAVHPRHGSASYVLERKSEDTMEVRFSAPWNNSSSLYKRVRLGRCNEREPFLDEVKKWAGPS